MGEKRTKPNHLNISERQRYLMRREKKLTAWAHREEGLEQTGESCLKSRFLLMSCFSCRECQEGAEQGSRCASGHGASCPMLAIQFRLVKEAPVIGAQLINRCCRRQRVPRSVEALGRFCFPAQGTPTSHVAYTSLFLLLCCLHLPAVARPIRQPGSACL